DREEKEEDGNTQVPRGGRGRQRRRAAGRVTNRLRLVRAARILRAGGVIAYPTEAVFGLGCLPRHRRAVERVLAIKRRPARKGLILIAAEVDQLARYVVLPPEPRRSEVLATWPGPATWVLDARR